MQCICLADLPVANGNTLTCTACLRSFVCGPLSKSLGLRGPGLDLDDIPGSNVETLMFHVINMTEEEVKLLGGEKQVQVLERIRDSNVQVCNLCGKLWGMKKPNDDCDTVLNDGRGCLGIPTNQVDEPRKQVRTRIYSQLELQDEFVDLNKVYIGDMLFRFQDGEGGKLFAEASDNWDKWPKEKRLEFLNKAVQLQSEIYNVPAPQVIEEPKLGPRKCSQCGEKWPNNTTTGVCTKCSGKDTSTADVGGCDFSLLKGKLNSRIEINVHDNVISDFYNVFNTIMHESTHNLQIYLVQKYRENREELFKSMPHFEPMELQIKMWAENILGYAPSDCSQSIYENQPTESHAFGVGNAMEYYMKEFDDTRPRN